MSEEEKEIIEKLKHTYFNYETYYLVETAINCIDKLQKENKEYIDIFNSTEKIMNGQERTKDKLLKENVELQKENEELKEQRKELNLENQALYESIKLEDSEYLAKKYQKLKENSINKDIIRNKIKEVAEEPQIYVDTEKFDIEFEKSNYTIEVLKELLGE